MQPVQVTWKADGTRYLLLLCMWGTYLVDRSFHVRRVQMRYPLNTEKGHHRSLPIPTMAWSAASGFPSTATPSPHSGMVCLLRCKRPHPDKECRVMQLAAWADCSSTAPACKEGCAGGLP